VKKGLWAETEERGKEGVRKEELLANRALKGSNLIYRWERRNCECAKVGGRLKVWERNKTPDGEGGGTMKEKNSK